MGEMAEWVNDDMPGEDLRDSYIEPLVWRCQRCEWVYVPTTGMGIHRVPTACPTCGGKVLGKRTAGEEQT